VVIFDVCSTGLAFFFFFFFGSNEVEFISHVHAQNQTPD